MNELYRTLLRCLLPVSAVAFLLLPSSAQAEKGMLRIVTEPGDAQIMIDGKLKGNSPSEAGQSFAIKLDEGEHQVQAIKSSGGLKEHFGEKKIFVADDTMQTITLKLEERASEAAVAAAANYVPAPEMVTLPAGTFLMGCQGNDQNCNDDEKPPLEMTVPAFEIGKYEVTFEMLDACYAQGGCKWYPGDEGWGRGNRPVINVSWNDIQEFLVWLNGKTGKTYRLPSEPEWEYAARAGTTTVYSWGDEVGQNNANCEGCGSQWDDKQTAPVGSFAANPWGIYDMHGNVEEWVSGCKWTYEGSSKDATVWHSEKDCGDRVYRGGSWSDNPERASYRSDFKSDTRFRDTGFRLARTIQEQFTGTGAVLREEAGIIKVGKITAGSAAAKQGDLQEGDILLQVAQGADKPVDLAGKKMADIIGLIRGPKGSEVRLTVKKPQGETKIISIIRDIVDPEKN